MKKHVNIRCSFSIYSKILLNEKSLGEFISREGNFRGSEMSILEITEKIGKRGKTVEHRLEELLFTSPLSNTSEFSFQKVEINEDLKPKVIRIIELAMIFLATWILVSFWDRFLQNFFFRTLKLDATSSKHTFLVCISLTTALIIAIHVTSFDSNSFLNIQRNETNKR